MSYDPERDSIERRLKAEARLAAGVFLTPEMRRASALEAELYAAEKGDVILTGGHRKREKAQAKARRKNRGAR